MFSGAAGDTREEKEKNACIGAMCEKFPTKNKFGWTQRIERLAYEIQQIWLEKQSGYQRDIKDLSPLQFDGLIVWQDAVELHTGQQIPQLQEMYLAVKGIKT